PLRIKIYATALMWTMVFISCYFFIEHRLIEVVVLLSAAVGTSILIFLVKTTPNTHTHKGK
ncbi:MAG: hypothetical protein N2662_11595, partial [Bacteroidales bacterium]|nr:hypothetical protein [Bacteroidales bacterium]